MENGQKVITVICTGNTCRSPMAERLLAHALNAVNEPWADIKVLSAGVAAYAGDPASRNSVEALKKVGLDLSNHRSRPLSAELLEISDLVLTMTSDHLDSLQMTFPELEVPAYCFREWIPEGSSEVPDPFGGNLQSYLDTRDQIAEAIPSVIQFLKSHFNP